MVNTIIFDFDGTIANTLDLVVKIVNNHADQFGYKNVTKEDIPYLQGKKPKEILSHIDLSVLYYLYKPHVTEHVGEKPFTETAQPPDHM